ncbi:MAG: DMT family transporter [Ahrensia sp.]|nr:DMT family transporter [Ahrensia sp.]
MSRKIAEPELPFTTAFAALVVGAIAMGISPVFVRIAEIGPFASAFWRVFLALPVLILWVIWECKRTGRDLPTWRSYDRAILLCGAFFAGDLFFWHLAILNTTIANATLLSCLAPVWVALFSGLFIGERVTREVWGGLVICLLGAVLLIGSSYSLVPDRLIGDIYGVFTSLFFGLYILAVRVARRSHGAGAMTFMSATVTAPILFVTAIIAGQSFIPETMTGVAALVALGVLSHSGGQGLLAVALGSLSAAFSSLVIFIEALAAAFVGWLVFAETLTPLQGLGGLLILFGIWTARQKPSEGAR